MITSNTETPLVATENMPSRSPIASTPASRTVSFAGRVEPVEAVRATIKLIRYWQAFLRSDKTYAKHPDDWFSRQMTKREAREELTKLILVAINRKAGIADVAYRKQQHDYQAMQYRDCARVRA